MSRVDTQAGRHLSTRSVAAITTVIGALVLLGHCVHPDSTRRQLVLLPTAMAMALFPTGALVLMGAPGHRFGRLLAGAGMVSGVEAIVVSWPGWPPTDWLGQWLWCPPLGLLVLALLVFPDGQLPTRRWLPVAIGLLVSWSVATVALAGTFLDDPDFFYHDPSEVTTLTPWADTCLTVANVAITGSLAGFPFVIVAMALRLRQATDRERSILLCLIAAGTALVPSVAMEIADIRGSWVPFAVAVPLAVLFAALRYRLYDLHLIINRTVVWLVMSCFLVGIFSVVTSWIGGAIREHRLAPQLLAYGLVALGFEPLHRRVQRGVDRLFYGDRGDPYKVLQCLGGLFGRTSDPWAVLPELTKTVARSLKVPYVAVDVQSPEGLRRLAEHGTVVTDLEPFDLLSRGSRIGYLLVAPRSQGDHLTQGERRLLGDVALHAAVAAETTRLIEHLQRSREQLVTVSEEERRRLRRDLHDGLGPTLAGMSMQVCAASRLLAPSEKASAILDALAKDLRTCTAEVRELVDHLRPTVLDDGLAPALRAECGRFTGPALHVTLTVDSDLQGLPAAVEVATYRIVSEALANVTKHAHATRCAVSIQRTEQLTIEILDNGVGLDACRAPAWGPAQAPRQAPRQAPGQAPGQRGIGLNSMRDRAEELGGQFAACAAVPTGTAIRVHIPLADRRSSRQRQSDADMVHGKELL